MKKLPTCQVKQKTETWPYVVACNNQAEFATRPALRANSDIMGIEYLCEFHAATCQEAYGQYAVIELEWPDEPESE